MQQAILTLWGVPDDVGQDEAGPFATFGDLKVALPGEAAPVLGPMKLDARLTDGVWTARSFVVLGARTGGNVDSMAASTVPHRNGDLGSEGNGRAAHGGAQAGGPGSGNEIAGPKPGGTAFSGLARRPRPTTARSAPANVEPTTKPAATNSGRPHFDPSNDGHDIAF